MKKIADNRSIGFLLGDNARLIRRHFELALSNAGTGRTVAEARTLAFIRRYPGLRQNQLAERLGVEPMTLTGWLDALEKAQLIERTGDPADRRAKLITLTDKATPELSRIDEVMLEVRARAFAGFSDEQIRQVYALLENIQTNLLDTPTKDATAAPPLASRETISA